MPNDSVRLCRDQRVDIYSDAGRVRRVVDHPLNAPLLGLQTAIEFDRSGEATLRPGERTVVFYSPKAGLPCRVATATVVEARHDSLCLSKWQVEPGFKRQSEQVEGHTVHCVVPGNN